MSQTKQVQGSVQWLTELLLSYPNLTTWLNIKLLKNTRTDFGWLRPCLHVYKRIRFYCARSTVDPRS